MVEVLLLQWAGSTWVYAGQRAFIQGWNCYERGTNLRRINAQVSNNVVCPMSHWGGLSMVFIHQVALKGISSPDGCFIVMYSFTVTTHVLQPVCIVVVHLGIVWERLHSWPAATMSKSHSNHVHNPVIWYDMIWYHIIYCQYKWPSGLLLQRIDFKVGYEITTYVNLEQGQHYSSRPPVQGPTLGHSIFGAMGLVYIPETYHYLTWKEPPWIATPCSCSRSCQPSESRQRT